MLRTFQMPLVFIAVSQCVFPEALRGTWISSEKGSLPFTTDTVSNYPMPVSVTVTSINLRCIENDGDKFLLQ